MTTKKTGTQDSDITPPQRQWHRRPGQKIDDLLLKRHLRYAPLTRLINQSDQRKSLTLAVQALLPDALAGAVSVVNFRPPVLILRVANASLATRLRYQLHDLTTKLRNLADFDGLDKINLRVVQTVAPEPSEKPPRYLPDSAIDSLAEFAQTLDKRPDYLELKETILRLSKHKDPAGGPHRSTPSGASGGESSAANAGPSKEG